jgi:hypothetical protein
MTKYTIPMLLRSLLIFPLSLLLLIGAGVPTKA